MFNGSNHMNEDECADGEQRVFFAKIFFLYQTPFVSDLVPGQRPGQVQCSGRSLELNGVFSPTMCTQEMITRLYSFQVPSSRLETDVSHKLHSRIKVARILHIVPKNYQSCVLVVEVETGTARWTYQ